MSGFPWVGPWLVVGALLLLVGAALLGRGTNGAQERKRDGLLAVGLLVVAATLRLGLGPWAPLHPNGQGPMWIGAALSNPDLIRMYGPGYVEVFKGITRLSPTGADSAIFAFNALFSALAAPLVYLLARRLGLTWTRAAIPAGALALDAVSVRAGATESYFPVLTVLVLAATLAFLGAAGSVSDGRRLRALLLVLAGALLCSQAVRVHGVAWLPVALSPLMVVASPATATLRERLLRTVATYAVTALVVVGTSASVIADAWADVARRKGTGGLSVSAALILCAALPLGWLWFRRTRPSAIAAPATIHLVAMLLTDGVYHSNAVMQGNYDRLLGVVPAIAIVAALPSALLATRALAAFAAVAAAGLVARVVLETPRRTTEQLEYRWVREHLTSLPPGCRLAYPHSAGLRSLYLPAYLLDRDAGIGLDPHTASDLAAHRNAFECVAYVHSSLCSGAEGRPVCEAVERDAQLIPVANASFPGVPSFELPYEHATVTVAIFRVSR